MATRSASSSRPADGRLPAALAAVAAIGLFLAAWWGLHHDFFLHAQISDLTAYQPYGDAMRHGRAGNAQARGQDVGEMAEPPVEAALEA